MVKIPGTKKIKKKVKKVIKDLFGIGDDKFTNKDLDRISKKGGTALSNSINRKAAKEEKEKLARKKTNRKKIITNTKKRNAREEAEYKAKMKRITGRLKNRKIKPKKDGSATSEKVFRKDQARGSFERAKTLEKGSMEELADTYDKMLKGAQRNERLKKNSRFLPLFKKRDMGNVSKKSGGSIKAPKVKQPSWMKGLSEDQIKEMIGGPKVGGERRANIKKKKKKKNIQMANVKVKKIPTVPMDPSLSATFRRGGKGGTKSRQPKKFIKKYGGLVKRKKPGKIGSGDQFVRDCYK